MRIRYWAKKFTKIDRQGLIGFTFPKNKKMLKLNTEIMTVYLKNHPIYISIHSFTVRGWSIRSTFDPVDRSPTINLITRWSSWSLFWINGLADWSIRSRDSWYSSSFPSPDCIPQSSCLKACQRACGAPAMLVRNSLLL